MSQENSASSFVLLACQRGVDCISELPGVHKEGDKYTGAQIALKWKILELKFCHTQFRTTARPIEMSETNWDFSLNKSKLRIREIVR